jgi:hypothetical protein
MKRPRWVSVSYLVIAVFLAVAWFHIGRQMIEQHGVFRSIKIICNGPDHLRPGAEQFIRTRGREGLLYALQELAKTPSESAVKLTHEDTPTTFGVRFYLSREMLATLVREIIDDLRTSGKAFQSGRVYAGRERMPEGTTLRQLWRGRDDAIAIADMVGLLSQLHDPAADQIIAALVEIGDACVPALAEQLDREKVDPVLAVPTKTQTKAEREAELNEENRLARKRCAAALGAIASQRAVAALRADITTDDGSVAEAVGKALDEAIRKNPGAASGTTEE